MLKSLVHRPASGARAASVELIFNKTPGGSREGGGEQDKERDALGRRDATPSLSSQRTIFYQKKIRNIQS